MKKIVIAGYGGMGRKYAQMIHCGEIPGLSVAAILCRNQKGQEDIRKTIPEAVILTDEEQLLRFTEYDAGIITTPHRAHIGTARIMVQAGKHVLCEKPISAAVEDCRQLSELILEKQVIFGLIFNWRARSIYRLLHDQLQQGVLGKVNQVVWIANFWFRPDYYHRQAEWRSCWKGEGGGLLLNQSQHLLDMWNWLFGQPDAVYAQLGYGSYSEIEVDDKINLVLTYENGMTGSFISSTGDFPGSNHLEIHGEMGKIIVEDDRKITVYKNESSTTWNIANAAEPNPLIPYTVESREILQEEEEYRIILRDFSEAIHQGKEPAAGLKDGIRALEISNAGYLSSWTGKKVKIPCDPREYAEQLAALTEGREPKCSGCIPGRSVDHVNAKADKNQ